MKKALTAIMAVSIAALTLTGCTGKYMGEWVTKKVNIDGDSYDSKYFEKHEDYDIDEFLVLELEKGGEGTISLEGGEEESDIEWEIDGDEITIDVDDDDLRIKNMEGKLKDDKIVLEFKWDGDECKITLVKDD